MLISQAFIIHFFFYCRIMSYLHSNSFKEQMWNFKVISSSKCLSEKSVRVSFFIIVFTVVKCILFGYEKCIRCNWVKNSIVKLLQVYSWEEMFHKEFVRKLSTSELTLAEFEKTYIFLIITCSCWISVLTTEMFGFYLILYQVIEDYCVAWYEPLIL